MRNDLRHAAGIVGLVLLAFNIAVAQPLLDLLGGSAEFFVAHDLGPGGILLLASTVSVLIPLGLAGAILLLDRLDHRAGVAGLVFILAGLSTILLLQIIKRFDFEASLSGGLVLLVVGVVASVTAVGLATSDSASVIGRWALLVPFLVLGFFVFASPASGLIFGSAAEASEDLRIGNPVPTVLVVFDEIPVASLMTPEGAIDEELYPNFARLANASTWFRNTTTVDDHTKWAVPAILDGRLPEEEKLPTWSDHPQNLLALLGGTHRVVAHESMTALCPDDVCTDTDGGADRTAVLSDLGVIMAHITLPTSWSQDLPPLDQGWAHFAGGNAGDPGTDDRGEGGAAKDGLEWDPEALHEERVDTFRGYLDRIGSTDPKRDFYFIHSLIAHKPWRYLPSGKTYPDLVGVPGQEGPRWGGDEWLVTQAYQRHLLEIGAGDLLMGELLDRLQTIGIYDESLLIVVADHGIAFKSGAVQRGVREDTAGDIAHVPLFVKFPGQSERRIEDAPAQTIDIVPTILDVIDAQPIPEGLDGRSLAGPTLTPSRERKIGLPNGRFLEIEDAGGDVQTVIDSKYERFLPRRGSIDPFAVVPGGDGSLLGQQVTGVNIGTHSTRTARLVRPEMYQGVELDQDPFPAIMLGFLDERLAEDDPLVIAVTVNGRISALTRTFNRGGPDRDTEFLAMLPPDELQSGANDVSLYEVEEGSEESVLRPLSWVPR